MFTVTSYPHGTFCWADLSTHGGNAAVDFYSQLMGWQTKTQDSGFGTSYTMFRQDGHAIAGLAWLTREMSEIPSSWNNYVSVDDVDALMPTVTEGGGQIIQPPFDVPDGARIALILDPAGAALCLFQQRGNIGAGLVNTPGALCWWTRNESLLQAAAGLMDEANSPGRTETVAGFMGWPRICRRCGCPISPWPISRLRQSASYTWVDRVHGPAGRRRTLLSDPAGRAGLEHSPDAGAGVMPRNPFAPASYNFVSVDEQSRRQFMFNVTSYPHGTFLGGR